MKKLYLFFVLLTSLSVKAQTDASLHFDGSNDIVIIPPSPTLAITGDLTLECWAYLSQTGRQQHLITKGQPGVDVDGTQSNIHYFFTINTNQTLQLFMEYGAGGNNMVPVSTASAPINANEWHHFAVVRNSASKLVDFYVDGVKLGNSVSYPIDPDGGANTNFHIGGALRQDNSVEAPFFGRIDEVRVWSEVRTQAQILDHMNCSISSGTNLETAYNFNNRFPGGNNTGDLVLPDVTGSGFNGTITNFALTGTNSNFADEVVFFTPSAIVSSNDPDNTIDGGTEVIFSVATTHVGATPTYQWLKNGANIDGETGATYTTTTLLDADEISCQVDPSTVCFAGTSASNSIAMTVNGSTLPLLLTGFTVRESNCSIVAEWTTAEEENVAGFTLEISEDGRNYRSEKTTAAHNTEGNHTYKLEIPATASKLFYRLKIQDRDGSIQYSPVVAVNSTCGASIQIFPNPATSKLYIRNAPTGSSYVLYNASGIRVGSGAVSSGNHAIEIGHLKPGIYLLKARDKSLRFLKQ
jgi:hypothetical protein